MCVFVCMCMVELSLSLIGKSKSLLKFEFSSHSSSNLEKLILAECILFGCPLRLGRAHLPCNGAADASVSTTHCWSLVCRSADLQNPSIGSMVDSDLHKLVIA